MQAGDRLVFVEPFDGEWHPRSDLEHQNSVDALNSIFSHIFSTYDPYLWEVMTTPSEDRMVGQFSLKLSFLDNSYLHIMMVIDRAFIDKDKNIGTDRRFVTIAEHDAGGIFKQYHQYEIKDKMVKRFDSTPSSEEKVYHLNYFTDLKIDNYALRLSQSE